jgi:hypothetical protein
MEIVSAQDEGRTAGDRIVTVVLVDRRHEARLYLFRKRRVKKWVHGISVPHLRCRVFA